MSAHLPVVALVGRPNVGKSTIFNRLLGRRAALVDDTPGVTRDRIFGTVETDGRKWMLVDTGGIDFSPDDDILRRVRDQAQLAVEEADLVCFIVDGRAGLVPADKEIAQLLRRSGKPTVVLVNKLDMAMHEELLMEFHELALEPLLPLSAEHGRGVAELVDLVVERLEPPSVEEAADQLAVEPLEEEGEEGTPTRIEWDGGPIHVAVVGRPNVGKSSLVNRLLGEERMLASDMPGTTRDAVDAAFEQDGQPIVLIDTAGMRRKRSISDRVERFAVFAAVRSMERADIVALVLDASQSVAVQDARIASLAEERGKGLIIVANKWDLLDEEARKAFVEQVRYEMPTVAYAPIVSLSAKTGRSVRKLVPALVDAQRERHRRIGTSELNRFFRGVVDAHQPAQRGKNRPKLFFVSQPLVRPPTFIVAASHPEAIEPSYRRYLTNVLRERYGFAGTPLWVKFRQRGSDR